MNSQQTSPFLQFEFHGRVMAFAQPEQIIVAKEIAEVKPALQKIQQAVDQGMYAAGYLSYEASPAFDPQRMVPTPSNLPLLWFGLFSKPGQARVAAGSADYQLSPWQPSLDASEYRKNIDLIKQWIARGESYQINYTFRLQAGFQGDSWSFYQQIAQAQQANYSALLDLGQYQILSASPELFFRWDGQVLETRPMKGTMPRGRWFEEDAEFARQLRQSEKDQAENLMIVDLLRNDISTVAKIGSVQVPTQLEIEPYPTVFQMTSTVIGETRPGTQLWDILQALFPSGSITGAPKLQTMKRIATLEPEPRGIYCGTIGYMEPGGQALFNVPIRTVFIDQERKQATYGVGGGITWDSTADNEYQEALTKARFLTDIRPRFQLLESLRLEQGEYRRLQQHLNRLKRSATYFQFPYPLESIQEQLADHAKLFPEEVRKVRLQVGAEGKVNLTSEPLSPLPHPVPVSLATTPIDPKNRFHYHKTTYRSLYDTYRKESPDCFDVLLVNGRGELTEFTIGNLVMEIDHQKWTPFVSSGLLPGTMREILLEQGEIIEHRLLIEDLERASQIWLINSVRGWVPVQLLR